MSHYLHSLVARARGTATSGPTLHARLPLRFPLRLDQDSAPVDQLEPGRGTFDAVPDSTRAPNEAPPLASVADEPPAAHGTTEPHPGATAPTQVEPLARLDRPTSPADTADSVALRLSARNDPIVAAPVFPTAKETAKPESAPAPPPLARLRPAPLPALPALLAGEATEPRISVHIGRVEVRRPAAVATPQRTQPVPEPTRPAPSGLAALAAARRYVDRLVH